MKATSTFRLPLIGIFAACALFTALFTLIQLAPLKDLSSEDLVTDKAYAYLDDETIITPDEATQLAYTAYKGVLTTGNLRNNYWVRLKVQTNNKPTLVIIGPAYIDQADVWQKHPDGTWQVKRGGIQRGYGHSESKTLFLSVPVITPDDATATQASEVLLNIRTTASHMQARAYPSAEAMEYDASLRAGFGFYLGISLWVFTLCIVLWLATDDKIWLDAMLYDCAFTYFAASQSGMLYKYLPSLSGELASGVYVFSVLAVTLTMCRFTIISTALFDRPNWLIRPYQLGYLVCVLSFICILIGENRYALSLLNFFLLGSCIWGYVLLINLRKGDPLLLNTYRLLLLLYSFVPLLFIGSAMLQIRETDTLFYIASPQNNIFTMVMIMMLLGLRAWSITKEQFELNREKRILSTRLEMEKEKLAEAGGFLSMIIHEVKNPLNLIRLATHNLAREGQLSDYAKRALGKIERSVNSIDRVLERSIEAEDQTVRTLYIRKTDTEVNQLISELLGTLPTGHKSRIRFNSPVPIAADLDGELVALAVRNLLENAIKYSPPHSTVDLNIQTTEAHLRIQVDNSPNEAGFPDENQLFQKYYRARDALHISGTGLGLHWVKQVINRMGGEVTYTRLGETIRFELCLPI